MIAQPFDFSPVGPNGILGTIDFMNSIPPSKPVFGIPVYVIGILRLFS